LQIFRARGLKVTPQRQSIFRVLHGSTVHPTAEAVYEAVSIDMPTISLRAVYRRSVALRLADGTVVRALVDEVHEAQLTRDEITASVHYVRWELTPAQVATFGAGPVVLVADHAQYAAEVVLAAGTVAELARDLRQGG
jgi:hypothetical protein